MRLTMTKPYNIYRFLAAHLTSSFQNFNPNDATYTTWPSLSSLFYLSSLSSLTKLFIINLMHIERSEMKLAYLQLWGEAWEEDSRHRAGDQRGRGRGGEKLQIRWWWRIARRSTAWMAASRAVKRWGRVEVGSAARRTGHGGWRLDAGRLRLIGPRHGSRGRQGRVARLGAAVTGWWLAGVEASGLSGGRRLGFVAWERKEELLLVAVNREVRLRTCGLCISLVTWAGRMGLC